MSLRSRLLASFGLVAVVMLIPGVFAAGRLEQLRAIAVEGRSGHAAAVTSIGRMQALVTDLDRLERSYLATRDPSLGATAAVRVDSLRHVYERFRASQYGELGARLEPVMDDIEALAADLDGSVRRGRLDEATERFERLLPDFVLAQREYQAVADSVDALARAEFARADAMGATARTQTLAGVGLALLLSLLLTGFTTHHLTTPLRKLGRATARVADGAFEAPEDLPYERADEIGELSTSFGIMTRRLAQLDRTKSEFLGMVSHELKTPINVISAYAEMLRDDLVDVSEYQANLIDDVAEQARQMARLVSRLMDLSRLEAGTYQLQFETVLLDHFMADVTTRFMRLAADKGITLKATIMDSAPPDAAMDADIMRDQVLGNLILNAVRHTPEGGRIEVSLAGDGDWIQFAVADSGPGIPEEHRHLIFRKHYVADRTRAVGSGLGLAIAKEMVELHRGVIVLEDTAPGAGARFSIGLPRVLSEEDVELPAASFAQATEQSGLAVA